MPNDLPALPPALEAELNIVCSRMAQDLSNGPYPQYEYDNRIRPLLQRLQAEAIAINAYHWHVCEECGSRWPCIIENCGGGTKWGSCMACATQERDAALREVGRLTASLDSPPASGTIGRVEAQKP